MSWNRGSQLTPTSWGPNPSPAGPPIACTFAARLACVSTTPFGCDVEPEVNWSRATASPSTCSGFARAGPVSSSTAATNRMDGAAAGRGRGSGRRGGGGAGGGARGGGPEPRRPDRGARTGKAKDRRDLLPIRVDLARVGRIHERHRHETG